MGVGGGREAGTWAYLETDRGFVLIRHGMVAAMETPAFEKSLQLTIPAGRKHLAPHRGKN